MPPRSNHLLEDEPVPGGTWTTGDPIPQCDWDNVRNLIYAGFGRRRVARMLNLHENLVGEVFDKLAPTKYPDIPMATRKRILELVSAGACLQDIASDQSISVATARIYVKALGIPPRTVTAKYLQERANNLGQHARKHS